jgi:GT2 family glycosyltransferase
MDRPSVDVVVPFVGSDDDLATLCEHLSGLERADGDTIAVVDNRPRSQAAPERTIAGVRVISAPGVQSSYYARNRGVAAGSSPWLVFVDADVRVDPDLIRRYFEPSPASETAILAGTIANEVVDAGSGAPIAVRYAHLAQVFAQETTLANAAFPYAMTANCAIRRDAFEDVGGFVEHVRSGGDADVCIRIQAKDFKLEQRPNARVTHVSRDSVGKLLRQSARHGSGAAWLERLYPGFSPAGRVPGSWGTRQIAGSIVTGLRGDRERALVKFIDGARSVAFDLGRRVPNEVAPGPDSNGSGPLEL